MSVNVPSSEWRLSTAGGIRYKLVEQTGSFDNENAEATQVCIIRANQLLAFVLESFPLPIPLLNGLEYFPNRRMPGFPVLATKRISYAGNVSGKPIDPFGYDPGASDGTYEEDVRVTIKYTTATEPNNEDPSTFLEISADGGGHFLNQPMPGEETWEAIPGEDDEPVREINVPKTVREPIVAWTVTWSQIPFDFLNATLIGRLREKNGKVNEGAMSLFYDAPAETILFAGWSLRRQLTWRADDRDQPPVILGLKFNEKNFESPEGVQVTHNHFWRPGIGYRKLKIAAAGQPARYAYDSTDLDDIFAV